MAVDEARRVALHHAIAEQVGEAAADTLREPDARSGQAAATKVSTETVLQIIEQLDRRLTPIGQLDRRLTPIGQLDRRLTPELRSFRDHVDPGFVAERQHTDEVITRLSQHRDAQADRQTAHTVSQLEQQDGIRARSAWSRPGTSTASSPHTVRLSVPSSSTIVITSMRSWRPSWRCSARTSRVPGGPRSPVRPG